MARKSKLETVFTGDDRPFQRVAARVETAGKRVANVGRTFAAGFATIGGGLALRSALEKFDRIGKLSQRFEVSAETLQRLGFVAEQSGSNLETVAKAMQLGNRAGQEAAAGVAEYNDAFQVLGVNAVQFAKLDQEEQFLTLADAMKNATDRNKALAAGQDIMGRSFGELVPMMMRGREEIEGLGNSVSVLGTDGVNNIQDFNDALNKLSVDGLVKVAEGFNFVFEAVSGAFKGLNMFGTAYAALVESALDGDDTDEIMENLYDRLDRWRAKHAPKERGAGAGADAEMEAGAAKRPFHLPEWLKARSAAGQRSETFFGGQGVGADPKARGGGMGYLKSRDAERKRYEQQSQMTFERMLETHMNVYRIMLANLGPN